MPVERTNIVSQQAVTVIDVEHFGRYFIEHMYGGDVDAYRIDSSNNIAQDKLTGNEREAVLRAYFLHSAVPPATAHRYTNA